jgi:uncharacterized protein (TIRG00374 family)
MAAFLALLVWRGDVAGILADIRDADWRLAGAAALLVATSRLAHGVRWWLLIRHTGVVPLRAAVLVLMLATGVSVILPFRAGAALQLQVLHQRYGIDRAAVAGSLLAEGLLDGVLLVVFTLMALPFYGLERGRVRDVIVAAVVFGLAALVVVGLSRRTGGGVRFLPGRLRDAVQQIAERVNAGLIELSRARSLALLLLATVADWMLSATAHGLAAAAVGLRMPPYAYLVVELVTNAAGAVPLTQGNIGPYELVVRETARAFGVGGEQALAFALTTHAAIIAADVLVGVLAFWILRPRFRDLWRPRDAANESPPARVPPV